MVKTKSSGFIWKLLRVIFLKISFLMGNMVEVKTNQRKRFRDEMSIFLRMFGWMLPISDKMNYIYKVMLSFLLNGQLCY